MLPVPEDFAALLLLLSNVSFVDLLSAAVTGGVLSPQEQHMKAHEAITTQIPARFKFFMVRTLGR